MTPARRSRGQLRPSNVAWALLVADIAIWIWENGHSNEQTLPRWHSIFNTVTFYGGWLLLATLVVVSVAARRGR